MQGHEPRSQAHIHTWSHFYAEVRERKEGIGFFSLCFSKGLIFVLTHIGVIAFFEISNIFTGM